MLCSWLWKYLKLGWVCNYVLRAALVATGGFIHVDPSTCAKGRCTVVFKSKESLSGNIFKKSLQYVKATCLFFFLLCTSWQTLTRGLWICKTGHLKCTLLFLRVCRHRDDRCGSGMRCLQRMKPAWRARRGKRAVRWAGSVTETHRWIWIVWKHEIRFESLWVHVRLLCAPFKSGLTREDLFWSNGCTTVLTWTARI